MKPATAIAAVLLLLLAPLAQADSFSCGNRLVTEGDDQYRVLRACGEPDYSDTFFVTETHRHYRRGPEYFVDVRVDRWVYDFGRLRFVRHLEFRNGRLVDIKMGDRGEGRRRR